MDNIYIYNKKSLLEQFIIFYKENNPINFENAVEFFTVFGGLNRKVDCSENIQEQIETHILRRYRYLRNDVSAITKGDEESYKILSGLALGDRRTNSAFKRCSINFDDGIDIVDEQCENGTLKLEKTQYKFTKLEKDLDISEKLIFTSPFLHYWFACVSPIFKGVRDGNYKESLECYQNRKTELEAFVFEQLCHELAKIVYKEEGIKNIGRYWDNSGDKVKLLLKTKEGKIIAGAIKYTNTKAKKSDLNALINSCDELGIKVDEYIIFSKKGFSSELKSMKSDTIKLFSLRNFNLLLG